jgi:hypothetical protein
MYQLMSLKKIEFLVSKNQRKTILFGRNQFLKKINESKQDIELSLRLEEGGTEVQPNRTKVSKIFASDIML